jgi:hypothetical protein
MKPSCEAVGYTANAKVAIIAARLGAMLAGQGETLKQVLDNMNASLNT